MRANVIWWYQILQADGSNKTGCFDLTCPGFVQTNNEIVLGAAFNPISMPTDLTFQITIYIYKVRHNRHLSSALDSTI